MWRKSKKQIELEQEIKALNDEINKKKINEEIEEIEEEKEEINENEEIEEYEEEEDKIFISSPKVTKEEIKNYVNESYCIENWVAYYHTPTFFEKKKGKVFYARKPNWEIIEIWNLDAKKTNQLVYTALYGKKPFPLVLIFLIIFFVLIFLVFIWVWISFLNDKNKNENKTWSNQIFSTNHLNETSNNFEENINKKASNNEKPPSIIKEEEKEEINQNWVIPIDFDQIEKNKNNPSIYDNEPYWIIESYTDEEDKKQENNNEEIEKIKNQYENQIIQIQNNLKNCQNEKEKIEKTIENITNDQFSCFIWDKIKKACQIKDNQEICKNLYYKYRTNE